MFDRSKEWYAELSQEGQSYALIGGICLSTMGLIGIGIAYNTLDDMQKDGHSAVSDTESSDRVVSTTPRIGMIPPVQLGDEGIQLPRLSEAAYLTLGVGGYTGAVLGTTYIIRRQQRKKMRRIASQHEPCNLDEDSDKEFMAIMKASRVSRQL